MSAASAILLVSSFFFIGHSEIVFQEQEPFQCGSTSYLDSPIVFYFNRTDNRCLSIRKGCHPSSITTMHDSLEDCIKKNFGPKLVSKKTVFCQGDFYGKQPFLYSYGSKKVQVPYLMNRCHLEERMCPPGTGCSMGASSATCCYIDKEGESNFQGVFSVANL